MRHIVKIQRYRVWNSELEGATAKPRRFTYVVLTILGAMVASLLLVDQIKNPTKEFIQEPYATSTDNL